MKRVRGIDVSKWQGKINWASVATNSVVNVRFAVCRASVGSTIDYTFRCNVEEAANNGIIVGSYHYLNVSTPVGLQATTYIKALRQAGMLPGRTLRPGCLPPVLDVEDGVRKPNDLLHFLELVQTQTRVCPWVYTMYGWWNGEDGPGLDRRFSRYPLWVADWTPPVDLPLPWEDWIVYQETNRGSVPGIEGNVDIDVFNGDQETLEFMARLR